MTTDKRSTGRPRLYETSSAKLGAFRKRQESAGYLRKEVLVTKETASQLQELAKAHGVSTTDVASALLEHGLTQYQATSSSAIASSAPFAGALEISGSLSPQSFASPASSLVGASASLRSLGPVMAFNASASPVATTQSPSLSSEDVASSDPIQNFFARRKESSK